MIDGKVLAARRAAVVRSAVIAACALGLVAACSPRRESRTASSPPPQPSLPERVRVLAGDALVIDGEHIRLTGVYAPQGPPDARCWAEAVASKQVTEVVRGMIVNGRTISFTPTGGEDVFTRTYAKVALNGVDLGQTLYDQGLVAKTDGTFGWCRPVSEREPGAPEMRSVLDVGR